MIADYPYNTKKPEYFLLKWKSEATNLGGGVKILNAGRFFKIRGKKGKGDAAALCGLGAALQERLPGRRPLPLRSAAKLEVAGGWHE